MPPRRYWRTPELVFNRVGNVPRHVNLGPQFPGYSLRDDEIGTTYYYPAPGPMLSDIFHRRGVKCSDHARDLNAIDDHLTHVRDMEDEVRRDNELRANAQQPGAPRLNDTAEARLNAYERAEQRRRTTRENLRVLKERLTADRSDKQELLRLCYRTGWGRIHDNQIYISPRGKKYKAYAYKNDNRTRKTYYVDDDDQEDYVNA